MNSDATGDDPAEVTLGSDLTGRLAHEFTHTLLSMMGLDRQLMWLSRQLDFLKTPDFRSRWSSQTPNTDFMEYTAVFVENMYRRESGILPRKRYQTTPEQDATARRLLQEGKYGPPLKEYPFFPDTKKRRDRGLVPPLNRSGLKFPPPAVAPAPPMLLPGEPGALTHA